MNKSKSKSIFSVLYNPNSLSLSLSLSLTHTHTHTHIQVLKIPGLDFFKKNLIKPYFFSQS